MTYVDYGTPAAVTPPPRGTLGWPGAVAWAVILVVVATIVSLHEWGEHHPGKPSAATAAVPGADLPILLSGRMTVGFAGLVPPPSRSSLRTSFEEAAKAKAAAPHPADRLRAAVVAAELGTPADAVADLDAAAPDVAADPRLKADADVLRRLYAADSHEGPTPAERATLATDLGDFFGPLAVTHGRSADDPDRQTVLTQARRTAVAVIVGGVVVGGAFLVGLVLFVLAVVGFATGTLRPALDPAAAPEPPGRPAWLEAFAVWMGVFVVGSLTLGLLHVPRPLLAGETMLVGVTAAAIAWGAWRAGLSWPAVRRAIGWHTGRGVFTEVGLGLVGYVAGLPVVAAGAVLAMVLGKLAGVQATHPIVNQFHAGMGLSSVASLLLVAAVGAPVLEETIFRGALYAHLRRRHAAWISALVVALLFAAIHPQGWTAIPVLASIALVLAALREWRGSLIAPMVGHALNNGFVVCLMAVALG